MQVDYVRNHLLIDWIVSKPTQGSPKKQVGTSSEAPAPVMENKMGEDRPWPPLFPEIACSLVQGVKIAPERTVACGVVEMREI